jgi:16S rRNA processing protein RimM
MDNQSQSDKKGSVEDSTEPSFLVIGQITKPHGVRGEVRVQPHTDDPQRFVGLKRVFLGDVAPVATPVEQARLHQEKIILKLAGYDNRNDVEGLRGVWVLLPEEEAAPLEEGEYYLYQLIGLEVITDEGVNLGQLEEVIETGANLVFRVQGALGEVLLPDIDEVVLDIDFANGRMTVHLLPGLLPG